MPPQSPDFDYVPLVELRFDVANPRFPASLDGRDLSAVLRFMLQDAGLIDLMRSIAKQGFFPGEPLLVSPAQDTGGWVVVEGNRRLAACTLLSDPELAPINQRAVHEVAAGVELDKIIPVPCLKFASREAILTHLGYRHVTGIKEWDPLAKARFLQQQFDGETGAIEERLRSTARSIGSRSDYVGRLLTAYRLYQELDQNSFFGIRGLSERSINFSLIPSVLAYSTIVEYLGLSGSQDLEATGLDLAKWEFLARFIFETDDQGNTGLGESRNIRGLADVLANERARAALEQRTANLSQARQLLSGSGSAFRSLISQAEQNLQLARQEASGIDFDQQDVESVDQVRVSAIELRNLVQRRIDGSI